MTDNKTDLFLTLLTPVQTRIYAFILSLCPNRVESEDILQETILTMWNKFDTYVSGTDFLAWAVTIAKYNVLTHRNKTKRSCSHFDEKTLELLQLQTPQFLQTIDERLDVLDECVKKLPETSKTLVRLRYDKGLPTQTIAERFDLSTRAVYKKLSHIHNVLMNCIRLTLRTERLG
jgi:RNA polymerase sigma-70 factor (ECF subfamily)